MTIKTNDFRNNLIQIQKQLLKLLNIDNDAYARRFTTKQVQGFLKLICSYKNVDDIVEIQDKTQIVFKKNHKFLQAISNHVKFAIDGRRLICVEDNTIVITKELQKKFYNYLHALKEKEEAGGMEEFYTIDGKARLKSSLTTFDFDRLLESEDSLDLKDFGNVDLDLLEDDVQTYDFSGLSKTFDSSSLTKFGAVDIINKTTETIVAIPLLMSGVDNAGYMYHITPTNLANISSLKVKTMFGDDTRFIMKPNLKATINQTVYVYDAIVTNDKGERQEIQVQSYQELETAVHDLYGFFEIGSESKEFYIKAIASKKLGGSTITLDDIQKQNGNHVFFKLVNLCYSHFRKHGFAADKGKSDLIVLNEVLKLIFRFTGYDSTNFAHSIYAGMRDVGKSYMTTLFEAVQNKTYTIITPGGATYAGIIGGANQVVKLPNHTLPAATRHGAIAGPSLVFDEFMEAFETKGDKLKEIMAELKSCMDKPTVRLSKVGGGVVPRNAKVTLIGNYQATRIEKVRIEIKKLGYQVAKKIRNDNEIAKLGEIENENLMGNSGQGSLDNPKFEELCNTQDLFMEIDEYLGNTFEEKVFKRALIEIRQKYFTDQTDISTGLSYSELKRFPFSIFGTMSENLDATSKKLETDLDSLKRNNILKLSDLYIPNLRELFQSIVRNNKNKPNPILCRQFLDEIRNSYASTFEIRGADTFTQIAQKVLYSLMELNNEIEPSKETMIIVERWVYLQGNKVLQKEVESYKRLNRKIKWIADRK